jgi:hypothetical protein
VRPPPTAVSWSVGAPAGFAGGTDHGVGPFRHDLEAGWPTGLFGGTVTVHTGPEHPSHVLLPVAPEEVGEGARR